MQSLKKRNQDTRQQYESSNIFYITKILFQKSMIPIFSYGNKDTLNSNIPANISLWIQGYDGIPIYFPSAKWIHFLTILKAPATSSSAPAHDPLSRFQIDLLISISIPSSPKRTSRAIKISPKGNLFMQPEQQDC
jgi:hypothetical protein